MKKFLGFIILCALMITNVNAGTKWGKGELTLSNDTVNKFINYIRGNFTKSPYLFVVSNDGNTSIYFYCPSGPNNCRGGDEAALTQCQRYSNDIDCSLFARTRTIMWKNNINRGDKNSKINSKWSDDKIREKLASLGFLDESKKKTKKKSLNSSLKTLNETNSKSLTLIEEIEKLNELYESGILTKDEFNKAKKKILN